MPDDVTRANNQRSPNAGGLRGGFHDVPDSEFAPRGFETTPWSVVLKAGQANDPERTEALERLCRNYWEPVYAYLRRKGHSVEDAEDLTQAFLAHLLTKDMWGELDPRKGRFRTYLLVVLKRFAINHASRDRAAKRGGGLPHIPLEISQVERRAAQVGEEALSAEESFDRRWALTVLDRALYRLRSEAEQSGSLERFGRLEQFLSTAGGQGEYAAAGSVLGITSDAVKVAVYRLRQRFGVLVRMEVAATVSRYEEADDEVRYLLTLLG